MHWPNLVVNYGIISPKLLNLGFISTFARLITVKIDKILDQYAVILA